jgi:hypothetical protein
MKVATFLVLGALLLAGCAKPESVQGASFATGAIEGVVTDPSQNPIDGALVQVDGANRTATTDKTGAFRFALPPGEYLVLATSPGHRGEAQRAHPEAGASVKLAFVLTPLPTEAPTIEVAEAHGLLSCALTVQASGAPTTTSCGGQDPNERKELKLAVPSGGGLEGIVVELAWTATTPSSNVLKLTLASGAGEETIALASAEGAERVTLVLPARVIEEAGLAGTDLVARVEPAGSFTDEEAALDAGAALQQPFTVYASYFYHAAPSGGYSAIREG